MSMMLWKTLALGGVIGAGSIVVVQAQRSLTTDAKPPEQFDLLDQSSGLTTDIVPESDTPPKRFSEPNDAAPTLVDLDRGPGQVEPASSDGGGNPFASAPARGEVATAMAEVPAGDPFGAAGLETAAPPTQQEPGEVTVETPPADQLALIDPAAQQSGNPFGTDPVPLQAPEVPLKRLDRGGSGPVLLTPPGQIEPPAQTEPAAPADLEDNPFARFGRPTLSPKPAAQPVRETAPGSASLDSEVTPASGPPLRTRATPSSPPASFPPTNPIAPVPAAIEPPAQPSPQATDMLSIPQRNRSRTIPAEPEVASPQDSGLGSPLAPRIPEVNRDRAPRSREFPAEQPSPTTDSPPGNPFGGSPATSNALATSNGRTFPAEESSIPAARRPVPSPIDPISPAFPPRNEGSSIPPTAPQTNPNPQVESNPFGSFPAANDPLANPAAPPTAPATKQSDFIGNAVVDRNVATGPSQPQMTIMKQAPSEAVVGQDLTYSILVKNIGRSPAHNVVVEDMIPRGSKCTGTIPKAESQIEKKNLLWKLGTIAPGAEQLLQVRITPTDAGEIGSIATVSFSAEVASKTVIVEPKAALTVNGPRESVVGEPSPYRFTLTNNGPVDLKSVFVRTVLPTQGLTHPGGTDLEYEVGDLPRGKSKDVTLSLTPSKAGDWQFQSQITLKGRELSRQATDVHVVGARLTVTRTGPSKRFVGRQASYINTVSNNSGQSLTNITVVETLNVGLDPAGQIPNANWDSARRTLTWVIGRLDPGQTMDLPVSVIPRKDGTLEGRIQAFDSQNNRAELATALEVAGFSSLVIDGGNGGKPVAVGDQVSYRFSVKNSGTAPAEKVAAMFDLPDEVELISAQGPGNVKYHRDGRLIIFDPIASVPAQTSLAYDVVVQAKAATAANGNQRIRVSLHSAQLPAENPLQRDEQLVIFGDAQDEPQRVQQTAGTR